MSSKLITILLTFVVLLPMVSVAADSNTQPLFELMEYRSDLLDLDNDDEIDRVRVVFVVGTTLSQTQVSAEIVAVHGKHTVIQWDNFTVTHNESASRSIFVDAWDYGEYSIQLRLFDPISGELVSDIHIGDFELTLGFIQPSASLNIVATSNGKLLNDGFRTGDDCKLLRTHHDAIGHRYNLSGHVQFLGAPWLVTALPTSTELPSSDEVDCSEWPAGTYSLLMVYHNALGYSIEVWNNFTILNQPAPSFQLNITGDGMEIGTICEISVEPLNPDLFSASRVDWIIDPTQQGVDGMQADCAMWMPGVHRIIVTVTNTEGITATEGFNLVRIPPLDGDMSQWANETTQTSWPVRSGGEVESSYGGYAATGFGMLIMFFVALMILRRFNESDSQGFLVMDGGPESGGLPTHLDEDGHLWRQHPNGEIDWWDPATEMWTPFE